MKNGQWTGNRQEGCDFSSDSECSEGLNGTPSEDVEWYYSFDGGRDEYGFATPFSKEAFSARYGGN